MTGPEEELADVDETVLDNSLYQVERERQGLGFTRDSWKVWTERQEAVPLPGAREFRGHVSRARTPQEFTTAVEQHFPREALPGRLEDVEVDARARRPIRPRGYRRSSN